MILIPSLFLTIVAQQAQLKSIRVFPGGSFEQYVRFVATSDSLPKRVNIVPEKFFSGMGPVRALRYSDGSVKLDPPLPSFLKYKEKGVHRFLQPAILPELYCRENVPQSRLQSKENDIKKLQLEMTPDRAPGIDGSFRLGNGLSGLGYQSKVHPFFDDMWVNVRVSGNWQPDLLEAIAGCVGATVVKKGKEPTTFSFEPNVEEIRARAIATLELFTPSFTSEALQLREKAHYDLVKNCSTEFLKRWIDASIKPDEIPLPSDKWAEEIRSFYTMMLTDILKQNPNGPLSKWTIEDFKAMPVFIRLNKYLQFSVRLQPSNDLPIWL